MNVYDKKYNGRYLADSVLLLALMLAIFFLTEKGVPASGIGLFVRKSIICSVVLYIVQQIVRERFFSGRWLAAYFIIVWEHLYILFQVMFFNRGALGQIYENEIFIAFYGAAGLIFLQYWQESYGKGKWTASLLDLPQAVLTVIPLITLAHWLIYGYAVSFEEMMAVSQTSWREATEWLVMYVGFAPAVFFFLGILAEMYLFYCLRCWQSRRNAKRKNLRPKYLIALLAVLAFYYPCKILSESDWTGQYVHAVAYEKNIARYRDNIGAKAQAINFRDSTLISSKPHTVIIVIGESANRDKLQAYNEDYPFADTPWMQEHKQDKNFLFFTHGYACQSLTLQVMEQALTEKSAYNEADLLSAMNFIDIAKAKGYKTYWITNLAGGDSGSFFAMVAARADYVFREAARYDENMLKFLPKVNPAENNLIVLHGNGSHGRYADRYPDEQKIFDDGTVEAEYANAIHYVDNFLAHVYDFGTKNLNMQVMLYFSDHGENLQTGHGPSDKDFVKVRIPVMIYLSEAYQQNNPEAYSSLLSHQDSYFTNDMMYNTICGLLRAKSEFYDGREDLASHEYSYERKDLYTFGKNARVSDDPILQ